MSLNTKDRYIPIGQYNHFRPRPSNRGQPTIFHPGLHSYILNHTRLCSERLLSWSLESDRLRTETADIHDTCHRGCDGVIDSDVTWDQCGICGGDNTSCAVTLQETCGVGCSNGTLINAAINNGTLRYIFSGGKCALSHFVIDIPLLVLSLMVFHKNLRYVFRPRPG